MRLVCLLRPGSFYKQRITATLGNANKIQITGCLKGKRDTKSKTRETICLGLREVLQSVVSIDKNQGSLRQLRQSGLFDLWVKQYILCVCRCLWALHTHPCNARPCSMRQDLLSLWDLLFCVAQRRLPCAVSLAPTASPARWAGQAGWAMENTRDTSGNKGQWHA